MIQSPPAIATEAFTDANAAVARLEEIYDRNTQFLRDCFEAYLNGQAFTSHVRACYPFVRMTTATRLRVGSGMSLSKVNKPLSGISTSKTTQSTFLSCHSLNPDSPHGASRTTNPIGGFWSEAAQYALSSQLSSIRRTVVGCVSGVDP